MIDIVDNQGYPIMIYCKLHVSTSITALNIYFFYLRKIDNRNKWKNYVIVTRVKLRVELDVLVIREQTIFIQL